MLTVSDNHIVLGGGGGGGGGGGDVVGAASSTDNAIARFDGTTGKIVQNSSVTITDAGNIGVGTPSPSSKLEVSNAGVETFQFNPGFAPGLNYFKSYNKTTNALVDWILDANNLRFYTSATARVTITASGDVGIGTASPSAKLDVDGTSRFRGNATFNGQIIDNVGSSGADGQVLKKVGGLVIWANP